MNILFQESRNIGERSEGEYLDFWILFDEFFEELITGEGYLWYTYSWEKFTCISEAIFTVDMARIRAFYDDI
jgi:hypothetical protein